MIIKLTPGSIGLSANFTNTFPPSCNHVYRFEYNSPEKVIFEINLVEANVYSDQSIASVSLPLEWFPKDQIVRMWFPLKPARPGISDLLVLLDIHLAFQTAEFQAPFGNMLVKPKWQIPDYLWRLNPQAPNQNTYSNIRYPMSQQTAGPMYPAQYPVPMYPNQNGGWNYNQGHMGGSPQYMGQPPGGVNAQQPIYPPPQINYPRVPAPGQPPPGSNSQWGGQPYYH
ncbi:hypothetical protein TVAG_157360 [Trichomonas vaginalis G3]|uniref:Uncharacterized protein n=1 Tax=Trichomonas vaginalis (strain ATCC PRA-98 / G3) TaxID=412133 RepID=A2E9K8_TRIV3|nr:C2 domain (calcium/lipid-binding domain, CaLB) family [Trichomonas vaginalis G3]EAY10659.1 hypothetical protein TVAG_157360 [Trichomonas vaginalis G3]KAI5512199.1 C2 domain (calcium/lipid-binding domain, CaLB) family [Trichomonas vaginalis G3]|eukprot:XP_001322882.1 hypothetical protein [Trichomonas vaginalis G3]